MVLLPIVWKEVVGFLNKGKVSYPHKVTNNLTKEESFEIVKQHLKEKLGDVKIKRAHFHYSGIYEYPYPC